MDERRYFGLDALRGSMMMLGIVLHAAMFYLAAPPERMPIPADRNSAYVFDLIFHFIHSFRMPTFFVLAGFFAALLVEKRGLAGALRNRAARILAPLLVGMVTLVPVTMILLLDYMLSVRFGTHDLLPSRADALVLGAELRAAGHPVDAIPGPAHLWFLYYLCGFYLLLPLLAWLMDRLPAATKGLLRWLPAGGTLVVLAILTAMTLWPFPGAQVLEGVVQLKPHLPSVIYYELYFLFGYLVHSNREFLATTRRLVPLAAMLAALLFPLTVYLSELESATRGTSAGLHLATVLAHGLCTWSLIYLCIGGALRWFDRASPWVLYLSNSAYWVFLLHMPVVTLLAWALQPYDLPAAFKFTLLVIVTSGVCLASYHYWVQRTWIGAFLNGKRFDFDWPWRPAPGRKERPERIRTLA